MDGEIRAPNEKQGLYFHPCSNHGVRLLVVSKAIEFLAISEVKDSLSPFNELEYFNFLRKEHIITI